MIKCNNCGSNNCELVNDKHILSMGFDYQCQNCNHLFFIKEEIELRKAIHNFRMIETCQLIKILVPKEIYENINIDFFDIEIVCDPDIETMILIGDHKN